LARERRTVVRRFADGEEGRVVERENEFDFGNGDGAGGIDSAGEIEMVFARFGWLLVEVEVDDGEEARLGAIRASSQR
jgi:hypothetical protein